MDKQKERQTHSQTHALPSIYGWANILKALFDTFYFTTFASLIPFVKDKALQASRIVSWCLSQIAGSTVNPPFLVSEIGGFHVPTRLYFLKNQQVYQLA